jgi:hypothetical protein
LNDEEYDQEFKDSKIEEQIEFLSSKYLDLASV